MTTYTIYASSPTGYLESIDTTSEADAANGLGDDTFAEIVDGGFIDLTVINSPGDYRAHEGLLTFDTSGVSGTVSDADLSLYVIDVTVDTAGTLQARLHDFGASITTADWVNRAGLPGKTLLGEWDYAGGETGYQTFTDVAFAANINQSGSTRVLLHDESLLTTLAAGVNSLVFDDQTASGTTQDPKLVIEAGGSPQGITGALYTNSNTFYGATVGRGTVTITGALVSNAQTFYAATVGRGAVDIAGALFSNAPAFYGATVTRGSVDIAGALFTNSLAFYGATITTGAVIISGELFANGQTFYGATLSPGAVGITGALFENTNVFYAATVAGEAATQDIAGELVTNVSVFYGVALTTSNEIQGALYANDNTFFGATIEGGGTETAVTSAGRHYGTQYFSKTISQLAREKREEAERIAKRANRKVTKALARGLLAPQETQDGLLALVTKEVAAALPAGATWLTDAMQTAMIAQIQMQAMDVLLRMQMQADEDDVEVLLLAA